MNNIKSIYRIPLVSCIALMTILVCCAAFIGCPETQEMAGDVIMPPGETPPPPPAADNDEDKPPPPAADDDEDEDKPPPPAG